MKQIYGIDLAKDKFDVNFITQDGKEVKKVIKNNLASISKFIERLPPSALLCAEHTGVYGDLLVHLANILHIPIALVSGYEIKHSFGLSKGKSDTLDAKRIREYGERFYDKIRLVDFVAEDMKELKELHALRALLVKEKKMLITHNKSKEKSPFNSLNGFTIASDVISVLDLKIKEIEGEILKIITSNKELLSNYNLVTSVKGIGPITTSELIIKTNNFNKIDTAKKAASYAGVCPFPNSSGKMNSKPRTSHLSDKSLKTLLFLCATNAVRYNKEYRLYYERKKIEGKHHFLIMNNIANKMLRTVYSIVESKINFDENYIINDPREKNKKVA